MARGDVKALAVGRRFAPNNEQISLRVAKHCGCEPEPSCIEAADEQPLHVQPLNEGFFALERMRHQNVTEKKLRATKRGKVRGK